MKAWLGELSKTFNVREIYVFADFSNQSLRAEIPKIREVTNIIIETQNASSFVTKDFTDFIMLDHIYQKALSAHDIKAFIIFSGDGHFSSVASFLKNQCGKTVGIYGIRSAVSSQLRNTASWCVEIPSGEPIVNEDQKYYDMIFNNLKYLSDNNRGERKMYPTFWGTVDAVSAYYSADRDTVTRAMRYLIERDYIVQSEEKLGPHRSIKVVSVNWELAEREGMYKRSVTSAAVKTAEVKPAVVNAPKRQPDRPVQPKPATVKPAQVAKAAQPKPQPTVKPVTETKPKPVITEADTTEPKPVKTAQPKRNKPVQAQPQLKEKEVLPPTEQTEPKDDNTATDEAVTAQPTAKRRRRRNNNYRAKQNAAVDTADSVVIAPEDDLRQAD